jgi:hypothetical protein
LGDEEALGKRTLSEVEVLPEGGMWGLKRERGSFGRGEKRSVRMKRSC